MAIQCENLQANLDKCTCTFDCGKKGNCCVCLHSHLASQQLPGCCFPPDAESTGDRSFRKFIEVWKDRV